MATKLTIVARTKQMPRSPKTHTPLETKQHEDQDYALAEIDFINGLSVRVISRKYNKPLDTVRGWMAHYGWMAKRTKQNERISETLFDHNAKIACDTMSSGLRLAKSLVDMVGEGLAYLQAITKDEDDPVVIKHSKKFGELARHALTASSVYKNYTFEIGSEMAEKLIKSAEESIKKLKEEEKINAETI